MTTLPPAPPGVYSPGIMIRDELLERCKLIPPFTSCVRFSATTTEPVQPENVPYLGVYWMEDSFSEWGSNRQGEPHFLFHTKIGFSYVVQNTDSRIAQELAHAGYWSIMKLFHDANWKDIPGLPLPIMGCTSGIGRVIPGQPGRSNAAPTAEMECELNFEFAWYFEPIVNDIFESVHHKTVYPYPEDPNRQPIISDWTIQTSRTKESNGHG